jgi:hypothetical protein
MFPPTQYFHLLKKLVFLIRVPLYTPELMPVDSPMTTVAFGSSFLRNEPFCGMTVKFSVLEIDSKL